MQSIIPLLDSYAEILLYPDQDHDQRVESCIEQLREQHKEVGGKLVDYLALVDSLPLSKREELYIKTFDLNKAGTLDLGWHLFGEDYNRGLFLVKVRQYLQLLNIPETNELPDHVSQVLRVLGRMTTEEASQFSHSCVIPALETIAEGVQEDNPHDRVVQGLVQLLRSLFDVPDGFEESTEFASDYASSQLPVIQ